MSSDRIAKNTLLYSLVYFLPILTSFITMPLVTSSLTSSEYGVLSISENFADVLSIFVSLQLVNSIPRLIHDYSDAKKKFFSTFLYASTFSSLAFSAIILINGEVIYSFVFPSISQELYYVISFSVVNLCLTLFIRSNELFWIGNGQGKLVIRKSILQLSVRVGLLFIFLGHYKLGLDGVLWSNFGGLILTAIYSIYTNRSFVSRQFDIRILKDGLNFSLSIIPQSIGSYMFMYSDVFIMEKFVSLSSIGIYAIANRFSNFLKIAVNALNDANQFHVFQILQKDEGQRHYLINSSLRSNLILSSIGFMGISMFSSEMLYLLAHPRFYGAHQFIIILTGSYIFRGVYNSYMTFTVHKKRMRYFSIITIVAGTVNILLNIAFLPRFGPIVAAISTVISFGLTGFIAWYINRQEIEWDSLNNKSIILTLFILSISIGVSVSDSYWPWMFRIPVKAIVLLATLFILNQNQTINIRKLVLQIMKKN